MKPALTKSSKKGAPGLTLVEMLVSMALLGFVVLALVKVSSFTGLSRSSLALRDRAAVELQSLFLELTSAIRNAPGPIRSSSHSKALLIPAKDTQGNAYYIGYRINNNALETSTDLSALTDSNAVWSSPYNITSSTGYQLSGGEFLFCDSGNNCTRFTDTNGNGAYQSGVDAAGTLVTGSGSPLASPGDAVKIRFYNLNFDRNLGNPRVSRSFPNLYVQVANHEKARPGFSSLQWTNNSLLATMRGAYYDSLMKRFLLVGTASSGNNKVILSSPVDFSVLRDVHNAINGNITTALAVTFDSVALESDGKTAIVLDKTNNRVYRINLATGGTLTTLNFGATGLNVIANGTGAAVAFDPRYPNDFYLLGKNPANTAYYIYRRNKTTGAAGDTSGPTTVDQTVSFAVPGTLTSPTGMALEPLSGDLLIAQNTIYSYGSTTDYASSTDKMINIYRIALSSPTTSNTFPINLTAISGTTTGTNNFGLAYNPDNNHLFLVDTTANKMFEVRLDRLLIQ